MKVRCDEYGEPILGDPKLLGNPNYDRWYSHLSFLVQRQFLKGESITSDDYKYLRKILFPSDD